MRRIALLFTLAMHLFPLQLAARTAVDATVTSNTLEWPEIHFLLQNEGKDEIKFRIRLSPQLECQGGNILHKIEDDGFWMDATFGNQLGGTIAAQSWNHRTFRIGVDSSVRSILPCTIEAAVSTETETGVETKRLQVLLPEHRIPRGRAEPDFSTLVDRVMVEAELVYPPRMVIRVLLRNTLSEGIGIVQRKRTILCDTSPSNGPYWYLGEAIRQGEGGPVYIEPHGRAVLLAAVAAPTWDAFQSCSARIVLTSGGDREHSVLVPLVPDVTEKPIFEHDRRSGDR